MRRLTPVRNAIAAAVAVGITAGLAPLTTVTAVAAEAPRDALTIPAPTVGDPNASVLQQAGETGYLSGWMNSGFHWTSYADGTTKPVPVPAGYKTVYGTDSDIVAFVGDWRSVLQRDMRDGSERTVTIPADQTLFSVFGDAVVTKESAGGKTTALHVLTWKDGQLADRTVPLSGADYVNVLASDRNGLYLAVQYGDLTFVDRLARDGSRTGTRLDDVPYRTVAGGGHVTQWHDSGRLTVWQTDDLRQPARELTVAGAEDGQLLGTVGDQVLIARPLSEKPRYAELEWRVLAVPFTGGPERVVFERATAMPRFKADGSLLIGRAETGEGTGPGVYALRPGAAGGLDITKVADAPPVRTAVTGLALGQGRLTTVDRVPTLDGPEARLRSTDLTVAGALEAAERTDRGADPAQFPGGCLTAAECPETFATGDGRVVFRKKDGNGLAVVDAGGSLPARTVTEQRISTGPDTLRVSGRYAAARTEDGRVRVFDLDNGGNVRTGAVNAPFALAGSTLWTASGPLGGAVDTVSAVDVRTGRALGSAKVADCSIGALQATGTSLYWECGPESSGVYDTETRTSTPLPAHQGALLGDGHVVWQKGGELYTTDVRGAATTRQIGTPGLAGPGRGWTVDRFGGPLAYADAEGAVHVVPSGVPASALAVIDADTPAAFDAAAASWSGRWWLSKPAASWTLTLTHKATGAVARTLSGGEARGLLTAAWDGKDDSGKPVTNGAYTWSLTARPADGVGTVVEQRGALLLSGGLSSAYGTFKPVTPVRLMDTRSGVGVPKAKVGPGRTVTLPVREPGISAVVLNVTATNATAASFVSVYPSGTSRTSASNLNFVAGQTVPNLVVVPVVDGKVSFYNHAGSVDLLADVAGYYTGGGDGSTYEPVTPARLMDTRSGLGVPKAKVGPGATVTLPVGRPGISAVVLNVTATSPTAASFVSVYPSGTRRTSASNLNFVAGQTVPNLVVVPVVDGKVSFYNHAGSVDLLADVAGYYVTGGAGAEYKPMTPTRLMDTRSGLGVPRSRLDARRTTTLQVAGAGGVPASGVSAVVLNVTATNATATSFVSVYPSGTSRTSASNLNFVAGQTVPNLVVVPVVDGKVTFYNHAGSVDLIADIAGFYTG
ncbi:FlgD immunoglobulin-like domain containing protein [Streptomyces sp. NPDC093600]|uniref:FlgD immunoglobulin-like domain containing protein n=1 Tax=Streptomyces sp. NPDC093600 TaxID=3366047 RepID=UPI0038278E55